MQQLATDVSFETVLMDQSQALGQEEQHIPLYIKSFQAALLAPPTDLSLE